MMLAIEEFVINIALYFVSVEQWNSLMRDPRSVALMVGALVSLSGAWLGVFLLLKKMALTSDAISHTVLLGIAVVFLVMVALGFEASLASPFLLVGATLAGVLTVVLTELIQRSNLVKSDAALGLVFPLLFAIAVILISRFAEDVHIDIDAVLVGEIGLAAANSNSHCLDNCADVVITPDDPRAEVGRDCINCSRGGISPRSPEAEFEETCTNCGTYTAAQAWRERLIDEPPTLAFFPKALTVMGLVTILNIAFVLLFYKELKLSAFDEALAKALGFRPVWLTYALLTLVSLTAVGAFDAVGAILVVAFFVIPAGAAYLLTDRLAVMLVISPIFGIAGTFTGYELARGSFLGIPMSSVLAWLDSIVGLQGYTTWNVSISASIVMMTFFFFLVAWIFSPRYGVVSAIVKRRRNKQVFADQMLMGHLLNHMNTSDEADENAVNTLHEHLNWSKAKAQASLARVRLRGWVRVEEGLALLTDKGKRELDRFRREKLTHGWQNDEMSYAAVGD